MEKPVYHKQIRREGVYLHWYVFDQYSQLFTDGLCLRKKTANKKADEIVKIENNYWNNHWEDNYN